jgi:hypothetical protein
MEKISIDTQIYVNKLLEELEAMKFYEFMEDSEEIYNMEFFKNYFRDEITLQASLNELENGVPTLTEEQFDELVNKCVIKDALNDLVDQGLIEENFDPSEMDTVYQLKKGEGKQ